MPSGAGRKFDSAWCEVLKIESSSKVNCKHCNAEISGKIEQIKLHLEKCLKRTVTSAGDTESVNNAAEFDAAIPSSEQPSTSNDGRGTGANAEIYIKDSGTKRKLVQPSMESFSVKTSLTESTALDIKIASFFYANNIPFNAADSKEYQEMISALRPGYKGPSRKEIGGKTSKCCN